MPLRDWKQSVHGCFKSFVTDLIVRAMSSGYVSPRSTIFRGSECAEKSM